MAAPRRLRLSPSGPFVEDGVSGGRLQIGDGSTGLIWRQQGLVTGWTAVPEGADLTTAWTLDPEYHYDLEYRFAIKASLAIDTVGVLTADIEIEEAGAPGVWVSAGHGGPIAFPMVLLSAAEVQEDTRILRVTNLDLDRAGQPIITNVRTVLTSAMVAGTFSYLPEQSSLRVSQYVLSI